MYDTSDMSSEVEDLTWALVDDLATEEQIRRWKNWCWKSVRRGGCI